MTPKILHSISQYDADDIRSLYDTFGATIASLDCGRKCALHNPSGKPFCCDICHAVPAAYKSEWNYFKSNTDLWHLWHGDECADVKNARQERVRMETELPSNMILLACLGPDQCQREVRSLSCRQFPFFPYVTSDYQFAGLAYEWEFASKCWVINNLVQVTKTYRDEFVCAFDHLFALFQNEFDNYAYHSEKMRVEYVKQKQRIPLLHRNGGYYLVSPASERKYRVSADSLLRFTPYR
jgi:hypothetical protein